MNKYVVMITWSLSVLIGGMVSNLFAQAPSFESSYKDPDVPSLQHGGMPLVSIESDRSITFEGLLGEEELPGSSVPSIFQDSKGFLWFGTDDGLSRYDGYTFTVYRQEPGNPHSLSYNSINVIYEDRSGTLWIGTDGGGLNRFDRDIEQFTHYWHDPDDPSSLSHNVVSSIYEDRSGMLWIGTLGGGLNSFNQETGRFTRYQAEATSPDNSESDFIRSLYEDQSGTLWIGTTHGLYTFDRETEQVLKFADFTDFSETSQHDVVAIYEDASEMLWIGTNCGLFVLDRKTNRFTPYQHDPSEPYSLSHNHVTSILEDQKGTLWFGTQGGGLDRFHRETHQFIHYKADAAVANGLKSNYISTLYEDRSGILWIGSVEGGINKFRREKERFRHYRHDPDNPQSLSHDAISSIYEDHLGTLWIGTYAGGLNKISRETRGFVRYQHEPDNPQSISYGAIRTIFEDHLGILWIGTEDGGLNRFDRDTEQFVHYQHDPADPQSLSHDAILSICEDASGTLWIGMLGGGLDAFERTTERFTHYFSDHSNPEDTISTHAVSSIYADPSGTIWIGTLGGGISQFDPKDKTVTHYQNEPGVSQSLSNNTVWSISVDRSGILWVGTGGGLNKFDQIHKTFTHYRRDSGLPDDVIYGILEDEQGHLWLSTGNGISKFDPQTETFKNYDEKDGIQSVRFSPTNAYYKSHSGEIILGGNNGVTAFFPEEIKESPYIPQIVLTDFQIFDQSVHAGGTYNLPVRTHGSLIYKKQPSPLQKAITTTKSLTLSYRENMLSFEFSALDYAVSEKNQYAYMMEGFDDDWHYSGTRRLATYTGLPAGEYIFNVKGTNSSGVWNEVGTSLHIVIVPPFWQTLWFKVLILACIITVAALLYAIRIKKIKRQKQILEIQVNERTRELQESMRRLEDEIIERKHAEKALKESEEYNRLVIETMNEGLSVVDKNKLITYVNSRACEMFGYSSDEIIGRPIGHFLDKTNLEKLEEEFRKRMAYWHKEERVPPYELEWRRQDGSIFHSIVSPQPFFDEQGNFAGGVSVLTDITQRKQIEEELREAKAFTESIIQNVPEVIFSTDSNMQITYISPNCIELTGYRDDEFIKDCCLYKKIIHPDEQSRLTAALDMLMTGEITSHEYRIVKKDGNIVWIHESATPTLDAEGRLLRVDASMYDITELKDAEHALAEERNLLQTLLDAIPDMIYVKDTTRRYTKVNEAFARTFQQLENGLIGKTAHDILPEDEARAIEELEHIVLRTGETSLSQEVLYKDIAGRNIWMLKTTVPLRNESGEIVGILGINRDINERKHAEEALQQSEKKYRSLFEKLQDVFYQADKDGNIQLVSPSVQRILGYSQEEATRLNLARDLYAYPKQREQFLELMDTYGYVDNFEIQLKRKDGSLIWGSVNSHFSKDRDGKVAGVEGLARDITKRKQAEEELIDTNIELKETLEHLKQTQAQLVQSEKMAALGQLIAGIAHEVNTPLGAIRASIGNISNALNGSLRQLPLLFQQLSQEQQTYFLTLLDHALRSSKLLSSREERKLRRALRKKLEASDVVDADSVADTLIDMGIYEDFVPFAPLLHSENTPFILQTAYNLSLQQRNCDNILTAVERASKIVFALKTYAHYDHSGDMIKADIREGLDVVLTLYYNQLKHGIEVLKEYEDVQEIFCYPDELNQVWTNLIHNAIQAMQGQGTLEIAVVQQAEQIVVYMTDSGCGIPDAIKARVFEPFFTTRSAGEGSGLGLDIVRKIIDKHQGRIEVESQPGKTCFSVFLPIRSLEQYNKSE